MDRTPIRTNGLALASVVLSLVGAFTVIFTLVSVLLGALALISIKRNRDRTAGTGYAIFGIVAGVIFTGLSLFLYMNFELLPVEGYWEAGWYSGMVDYGGEREIQQKERGYAITRPSLKWGVAKKSLMAQLGAEGELMLVNPQRRAYVQVMAAEPVFGRNLDVFVDEVIKSYREGRNDLHAGLWAPKMGGFKLRQRGLLKRPDGLQGVELLFDLHVGPEELTFVEHILQPAGRDEFFRINGWASRRRFSYVEEELRRAIDSFRLLP